MDITTLATLAVILAFGTNITVQMLKGLINIPTKLLCLIVSVMLNIVATLALSSNGYVQIDFGTIITAVFTSPVVAFISMYGFDTFKELWERFKKGEDIDEQK